MYLNRKTNAFRKIDESKDIVKKIKNSVATIDEIQDALQIGDKAMKNFINNIPPGYVETAGGKSAKFVKLCYFLERTNINKN